jgi:hypothetical protein
MTGVRVSQAKPETDIPPMLSSRTVIAGEPLPNAP